MSPTRAKAKVSGTKSFIILMLDFDVLLVL
jgi:hypothetical protein